MYIDINLYNINEWFKIERQDSSVGAISLFALLFLAQKHKRWIARRQFHMGNLINTPCYTEAYVLIHVQHTNLNQTGSDESEQGQKNKNKVNINNINSRLEFQGCTGRISATGSLQGERIISINYLWPSGLLRHRDIPTSLHSYTNAPTRSQQNHARIIPE